MRVLPPSLLQKLNAGVTTLAAAWRLTRRDGHVVAVTQHDRDLSFDGTVFRAAQSLLGGDVEAEINLAPNRTAVSGALRLDAISQTDLALGRWDQAKIEAFWVDWTAPSDNFVAWTGLVAGSSWRGGAFELDIIGPETLLNREIGRVYARSCDAALGDGRCKVDLSAPGATLNTAITGVVSDRCLTVAVPPGKTAEDFIGGVLSTITGPAASWRCDVTRIEAGGGNWQIHISRPFPMAPVVGDAVNITHGCDKSFATCKARFANGLNFRGQPTLPGDDIAFGGPAISGNTGGRR